MFLFEKKGWKEGDYIFASQQNGEYKDIIIGMVAGVENSKVGVNGIIVNPVGLKNKIAQGKAGPMSVDAIKNPDPKDAVYALIYRVEHDNFTGIFDEKTDRLIKLQKNTYNILTGWIRESIPELINNVLSLPDGPERDQAKRLVKQRMDTLYDKDLKRYMYSVCRSLKILN
ncbi:MAG TPA: hypothetical protein VJ792_06330 [Candidatus Nitrosotalea sp.]|nr:hypothetical protein [Candidatus Nitrosotalea sp.]